MRAVVKKWGNSASVRIPSSLMRAARLKLDDDVEIKEEHGRIVIESLDRPEYDLDELLKGVTPKNKHKLIDFGKPAGKEAW